MNLRRFVIIALLLSFLLPASAGNDVRGWVLLSNNRDNAVATIKAAKEYDINHLQLSHQIVHDLREVKNKSVCDQVNSLTRLAHAESIDEVLIWDHSFYPLDYYPARFKTAPDGLIDLDNAEFWKWYKEDYRRMLDLVPEIDGLILTFIETGAYAEKQHSAKMLTSEEKLAAVVNAIADVVIEERGKKLYIRTFAYSEKEYEGTVGCIKHIKNDKVGLMMKEVPHDFFLTHPNNSFIGAINRPTIVEFDTGNEYNGQGVIANTWSEYVMKRWKDYIDRPNVIGYVARTDRYGTTQIVGTANEILLYTLKRITEDRSVSAEQIYDEFITSRYGSKALQPLKSAFRKSYDIVTSTLYTLGTSLADHSSLNYDANKHSYNRHVSGRWINPPHVFVAHAVNKEFHYWKDIVNHISPSRYKDPASAFVAEIPEVFNQQWLDPSEKMDTVYYNYILAEKRHGVKLAAEALSEVEQVRSVVKPSDYEELYRLFHRTYLTACLHEAVCAAYYGYRTLSSHHSAALRNEILSSLERVEQITQKMYSLKGTFPIGQYNWLEDADKALQYKQNILKGLSKEKVYPGADETSVSRSEYFSWINNTNEGPTEKQTLINLDFFEWLRKEYGMVLDIYAFDAGLIDGKNFTDTAKSSRLKKNFPNGLDSVYVKAKQNNTRFGLWGGPDGFGNTPESTLERKETMVSLCRDYDWALFKFDAVCGQLRREREDDFIDMMKQCRSYSPDLILLNHRLALDKAKPYATTFLWEGKEAYIDVNVKNSTTAIHNRVGTMERGLVPGLQRLTEDHGVCLSSCLDYWEDELVLHAFNRSLILAPQIYGNPWLLSDKEFPKLARIYNLHRKFSPILVNGMTLPQSYGKYAVSRGDDKTRLVTLRNLNWIPQEVIVKLDEEIGLNAGEQVEVRMYHPVERNLGTFQYGQSVKVTVLPFRSMLLAASTGNEFSEPAVEGADFELLKNIPNEPLILKLLGFPGTKATISLRNLPDMKKVELDGQDVTHKLNRGKSMKVAFGGEVLSKPYHRKIADMAPSPVPDDAETLYEATVFAADNNAMEVRSLFRSGDTKIAAVKAARDAFLGQSAFINRGIWDKNLFDENMKTGFWASKRGGDNRIKRGCFRLDLNEVLLVDSIVLKVNNEYELQPLLADEGNFVQLSSDLKNWKSVLFLAGTTMTIKIGEAMQYLKMNPFPDAIAEIAVYSNGKKLLPEKFRASNLFADASVMKSVGSWTASFQLDEIAKNSYLCVAVNGKHGVEEAYAALKVDGKQIGAPSRATSYPANPWENVTAKSDSNYTYFFPLEESMKGKEIEAFVLGYNKNHLDVKPEVWITSYPTPYEEKVMVVTR